MTSRNKLTFFSLKLTILFTIFTVTLVPNSAHTFDVRGADGYTILVDESDDGSFVSFRKCKLSEDWSQVVIESCRYLGPLDFYSKTHLEAQMTQEKIQAWVGGPATALLAAGLVVAGGGNVLVGMSWGEPLSLIAGTTLVALPVGISFLVRALNPVAQFRDMRTLSRELIEDELISVESAEDFAANLEILLGKI